MSYTEVSRQSWFSRIGGAIKGVFVGLLLLVIALPLLFWNEGRAVHRYKTLKEGASEVISIQADSVDNAHAGKLVHVSGSAETDSILRDSVFEISVNAIHLKRSVEMYQWKENVRSETRNKVGGGTETTKTYTYEKVWRDNLIKSGGFKEAGHDNPATMPFESQTYTADDVRLGAFKLSPSLVRRIGNYQKLEIDQDFSLPDDLVERVKIHGAGLYVGTNPMSPSIGDVRITFEVAYPTDISIVAKQTGNSFEAYSPPKSGGSIELLELGIVSSEEMFESAQASNRMTTWLLRLAGFLLLFIGLGLIFHPFKVMGDVLPIMGKIIGAGTGLIAFLLASVLSFVVIAIAWITYRPLLGVPLLLIAVALSVLIVKKLTSPKKLAPMK